VAVIVTSAERAADLRRPPVYLLGMGQGHPAVAIALNNLADLHGAQGEYAEAELLYRRSLAILESALGPEHPDVARSLETLSKLYRVMGRAEDAKELAERAAAIRARRR
jgi:tetratricopeptide (TPR) repeat protein